MAERILPCTGLTELFYSNEKKHEDIEKARAICRWCPYKEACLAKALQNDEQYGIWGGTTASEREALRDELGFVRPIAKHPGCGQEAGYAWIRRTGSDPCEECTMAHRMYNRGVKVMGNAQGEHPNCGKNKGWQWIYRRLVDGEIVKCEPCTIAHRAYVSTQRAKNYTGWVPVGSGKKTGVK